MNRFKWFYMQTQLLISNLGWVTILCMLLVSILAGFWGILIPGMITKNANLQTQLGILESAYKTKSAEKTVVTPSKHPLDLFFHSLGHKDEAINTLKTLFQVAEKNGIQIQQANYKFSSVKELSIDTYQLQLPIKATYPAIRRFCEEVLLAMPFANLDELHLKREAIGSEVIEAKLSFTLYLRPATQAQGVNP